MTAGDGPPAEHDLATSASWRTWALVVLAVAVPAFVGGFLIGLAPWYTLALVAAVVVGAGTLATWRRGADEMAAPNRLGSALPFVAIAAVVTFGAIQLVPYGRAHDNPASTGEPAWATPRARELMVAACYGCHSNEVEWPWYANIAPISWAITDHVDAGRDAVNYSDFATDRGDADESIEEIEKGSMPPRYYTSFGVHPEADLSDAEVDELIAGLRATPGLADDDSGSGDTGTNRRDDDDSS